MNETARELIKREVDRFINFREEKQTQVDKLRQDLASAEESLRGYDTYITQLQRALEDDE